MVVVAFVICIAVGVVVFGVGSGRAGGEVALGPVKVDGLPAPVGGFYGIVEAVSLLLVAPFRRHAQGRSPVHHV